MHFVRTFAYKVVRKDTLQPRLLPTIDRLIHATGPGPSVGTLPTCHALAGCAGTRLRSEFEYEMLMTTHDSFPTGQV